MCIGCTFVNESVQNDLELVLKLFTKNKGEKKKVEKRCALVFVILSSLNFFFAYFCHYLIIRYCCVSRTVYTKKKNFTNYLIKLIYLLMLRIYVKLLFFLFKQKQKINKLHIVSLLFICINVCTQNFQHIDYASIFQRKKIANSIIQSCYYVS